jgi:hypothetical protein
MPLLGESIDGALTLILVVPILGIALTLLSFWPSSRGHWSGPLLALPSILIGAFFSYSLVTDQDKENLIPGLWVWALAPLVVGSASACLWIVRRLSRRRPQ